jgi:DNA polymerase (family 10)
MENREIARILAEIGEYLEMRAVAFKPRAYQKAAAAIEDLEESVQEIYEKGGLKALEQIPGVGRSIAEKIEEFVKTRRLKYYERLKKETPVNLSELTKIEGLGPQKVKKLYEQLKIKNVSELEKAAKAGKVRELESFGAKSEENILKGIDFLKKSGGRFILGFVMPEVRKIENRLKNLEGVERVDAAGSVRRRKETVGDIDILAISEKSEKVMDFFVSMKEVINVYGQGPTRASIRLKSGLDADLRVVAEKSYGAALLYFTGSKDHNIVLRNLAIKKGLKLNEYGLFRGEKQIAGRTEEEVYRALGLDYIPPEMRENTGEIELAAAKAKLPRLLGYGDLCGDLQIQTDWTDGLNSIEDYADEAIKSGLEYIAITDHSKRLAMAHGLDEKGILRQIKEIDRLNLRLGRSQPNFRILKGVECDILKDGSLDIDDSVLEKLDIVGVSIHSHFNLAMAEQTKRLIRAMENKNADIVFHPTARILNRREPISLDIEAVIAVAKRTKTVLEIDAYPDRLDLKDEYARKCVRAGVKLAIDSDAHSTSHLKYLEWGVGQARRGWAEKKDVINAWPLSKMVGFLKGETSGAN